MDVILNLATFSGCCFCCVTLTKFIQSGFLVLVWQVVYKEIRHTDWVNYHSRFTALP